MDWLFWLQALATVMTPVFGVIGITHDFKDSVTKKVTFWGRMSIAGLIISGLLAIVIHYLNFKEGLLANLLDLERFEQNLKKQEQIISLSNKELATLSNIQKNIANTLEKTNEIQIKSASALDALEQTKDNQRDILDRQRNIFDLSVEALYPIEVEKISITYSIEFDAEHHVFESLNNKISSPFYDYLEKNINQFNQSGTISINGGLYRFSVGDDLDVSLSGFDLTDDTNMIDKLGQLKYLIGHNQAGTLLLSKKAVGAVRYPENEKIDLILGFNNSRENVFDNKLVGSSQGVWSFHANYVGRKSYSMQVRTTAVEIHKNSGQLNSLLGLGGAEIWIRPFSHWSSDFEGLASHIKLHYLDMSFGENYTISTRFNGDNFMRLSEENDLPVYYAKLDKNDLLKKIFGNDWKKHAR